MKIPRLSIFDNTFSNSIWNGFCFRYGKDRAKKIVSALSRPVNEFAIRVTLTKASREEVIEILEKNDWKTKQHKILPEIITAQTQGMNYVPYLQKASDYYNKIVYTEVNCIVCRCIRSV